ncbi:hypothetical protein EJB05_16557, partial [Eragrostis curvula]
MDLRMAKKPNRPMGAQHFEPTGNSALAPFEKERRLLPEGCNPPAVSSARPAVVLSLVAVPPAPDDVSSPIDHLLYIPLPTRASFTFLIHLIDIADLRPVPERLSADSGIGQGSTDGEMEIIGPGLGRQAVLERLAQHVDP